MACDLNADADSGGFVVRFETEVGDLPLLTLAPYDNATGEGPCVLLLLRQIFLLFLSSSEIYILVISILLYSITPLLSS